MSAAKPLGYKPTKSKGQSVENFLRAKRYVPDERIDCQDHLINLRNGVYNLDTGQLELHQPTFYQTTNSTFPMIRQRIARSGSSAWSNG